MAEVAQHTVAQLLPEHVENEDNLSLWHAPLAVRHSGPDSNGGVEYLAAIAVSLGRRGLMDFLAAIAPYKGRGLDDFSGVLDDWYIHDRALAGGASEKLFRDHLESLRDDWLEFTRHRRLFVDILEDRSEKTRLVPVLRWQRAPDGTRRWVYDPLGAAQASDVRQAFGAVAEESATVTLSPLAGFLSVVYFLPELKQGWPEWKPLAPDGKSNYMGPAQVPVLALLNKGALLECLLVERLEGLADSQADE